MVRRRCRFILAVDAGCDPDFAFEDLGNAVRKILHRSRRPHHVRRTRQAQEPAGPRRRAVEFKVLTGGNGAITKENPDRRSTTQRSIKFPIMPLATSTTGMRTAGIVRTGSSSTSSPPFTSATMKAPACAATRPPTKHSRTKSTGDQWFTESQFESYRTLGLDIMNNVLLRRHWPLRRAGLPERLVATPRTSEARHLGPQACTQRAGCRKIGFVDRCENVRSVVEASLAAIKCRKQWRNGASRRQSLWEVI